MKKAAYGRLFSLLEIALLLVIPGPPQVEPGIQRLLALAVIPAFAGMTSKTFGTDSPREGE
jgi:hypothetical protein